MQNVLSPKKKTQNKRKHFLNLFLVIYFFISITIVCKKFFFSLHMKIIKNKTLYKHNFDVMVIINLITYLCINSFDKNNRKKGKLQIYRKQNRRAKKHVLQNIHWRIVTTLFLRLQAV